MTAPESPQTRRASIQRGKDAPTTKIKTPTLKNTEKKAPTASGLKLGAGPGPADPKTVRDKIRNWQTTGGGVVVTPEAGASSDREVETKPPEAVRPVSVSQPSTPKGTRDKGAAQETVEEERQIQSAVKPSAPKHKVLSEEVREASAPKKRVVSDGHWRKNKSPPKEGQPIGWVRPSTKPKLKLPAEPQTKPVVEPPENIARELNTLRKRRQSAAIKTGIEAFKIGDTDSVKATQDEEDAKELLRTTRQRKKSNARLAKDPESSRTSLSSEERTPRRRRSAEKPDPLASPALRQWRSDGSSAETPTRHRRRRRRSPRIEDEPEETPPQSPPDDELAIEHTPRKRLQKKRNHVDPEKEDREQKPLNLPTGTFPTRIEAWLTETQDPFVETKSRSRKTSSVSSSIATSESQPPETVSTVSTKDGPVDDSIHKNEKRRVRRKRKSSGDPTDGESSSAGPKDGLSLPEQKPKLNLDPPIDAPSVSPSPLKRRSAVRSASSPTKDRADLPLIDEHGQEDASVVSSAPSSSVEGSMFDNRDLSTRRRHPLPLSRRAFPTTGKRLSTIASVETFHTKLQAPPSIAVGSEYGAGKITPSEVAESEAGQSSVALKSRRSFKSKTASHADLMSVLSLPRSKSKSLVSAHSIRTYRSRLETATMDDLMRELSSDEEKYKRELNTLVDGVIPVLLACVLSKSDAAVAAGLFNKSSTKQDPNFTQPIVDMGIALERLKSLHRRIPLSDPEALLSWAQSAERIYTDYIRSWRLGFQNVVVNLAPAAGEDSSGATTLDSQSKTNKNAWDEGLPRNEDGYVVNSEGERVDVAFLLKRPLVRLKWLSKTLKGINFLKPTEKAEKLSATFQKLVDDARSRNNEERARMEDEAAASIDPTRARDPKSLGAIQGVHIDPTRCVKARDYFDMHLMHSTGQEIDCRVELLLRDDPPEKGTSGDVLLCDLDATDRWLFFPPIQTSRISAREGDSPGELVVMIRGLQSGGMEWQEVFVLKSNDEEAANEWIQMLGEKPVPPPLAQISSAVSFISRSSQPTSGYDSSYVSTTVTASTVITTPNQSRNPSPREIEVPLGEPVRSTSKRWSQVTPPKNKSERDSEKSPSTPKVSPTQGQRASSISISPPSAYVKGSKSRSPKEDTKLVSRDSARDDNSRTPRNLNDAMSMAGTGSPGLRRAKATRSSRSSPSSPIIEASIPEEPETEVLTPSRTRSKTTSSPSKSKGYNVWYPPSDANDDSDEDDDGSTHPKRKPSSSHRPVVHRRASSLPSLDLPVIPRQRNNSQPNSLPSSPSRTADRSESAPLSINKRDDGESKDSPPAPPPHRSPPGSRPASSHKTAVVGNILGPILSPFRTKRRSSSPLKHEYEPSTATESSSDTEGDSSGEDVSVTSESSDEDSIEDDYEVDLPVGPPPLPPPHARAVSPPDSAGSLPETSLGPSNSASQAPYRDVPATASIVYKGIASIFTWREEPGRIAQWEPLCKESCSIVVKPGFIEVFELNQAHARPELNEDVRPLLALGLTPNVLVHRGTNIDIDIRSPPLGLSLLKAGNRTMFRSPFPLASEDFWQAVRWSRENNPTFMALQNARGAEQQISWAAQQERNNAARPDSRAGKPRWSLPGSLNRSRSYRASSTRALSINSSVDSKSSFFSALKRFGGSGRFSVARSSVDLRGSASASTEALDLHGSASGSSSGSGTPLSPGGRAPNAPLGVSNTKIRFHKQAGNRRWQDFGKARLHIMAGPAELTRSATGGPREKRILVVTKDGMVLLDVTVPETSFEIYGRVGIAVKVVEDIVGKDGTVGAVADTGGVGSKRLTVYMLQFKSNRQCKYNFLQLGKMRY